MPRIAEPLAFCCCCAFFFALVQATASLPVGEPGRAGAGGYKLYKQYAGQTFFDNFNFFVFKDETSEFVNRSVAAANGLIDIRPGGAAYMGADHKAVIVPNTGKSRMSVQIQSKETYTGGLFVADVQHMPAGCGTWPAFWSTGYHWPQDGEVDIIEGVNNQKTVRTTLHTGPDCTMKYEDPSLFTGSWAKGTNGQNGTNCYINASDQGFNQGCSISGNSELGYGDTFNKNDGGVYAELWNTKEIAMWFFPRGSIPNDATSLHPQPENWGKPYAYYMLSPATCPASNFNNHTIIFDTALCGSWAGTTFTQMCPGLGECIPYVDLHPEAMDEAYWLVKFVRIFRWSDSKQW